MTTPPTKPPAVPSPMQSPATWDTVASGYAEQIASHTVKYCEEALRIVPLAPTDRVLDVACGPGSLAFLTAPRVAHVDAVDFAPGMVSEVTARATRDGVGNVAAAVMNAQELGFDGCTFDAAFCFFAFMFFPDRARAFGELYRVLKPGGRALVATWAPIDKRPLMRLGFEAMAEALPQLPLPLKGDLQAPDDCIREMSAAGFRAVECRPFSASLRIASPEDYLKMIERTGPGLDLAKKAIGEAAWASASARMLDSLRRRILAGGTDLSAEALLTNGVR